MTLRLLVIAMFVAISLSGCTDNPDASVQDAGSDDDAALDGAALVEPFTHTWDGFVAVAPVDVLMHIRPTEDALYKVQPSGYSLDITGEPTAIEVMIEWEGDGAFVMHPHYVVNHDEELTGDTEYYGYMSDTIAESGGCMQIPVEDVVAGQWQMMIHPRDNQMANKAFTLTLGILGGEAEEREEFHGHRWDGETIMEDHGYLDCSFLPDLVA